MDIKSIIKKLQEGGIPFFLLQDPKTKEVSLSFTLVIISAFFVILGILSNFFAFLKGINGDMAFNFFMASASLYFARKISINNKTANSEKVE